MRRRTIVTFACVALAAGLALAAGRAGAATSPNSCIDCHRQLEEPRLRAPTRNFAQDVHAVRGLGCVGCHGGDPADPEITAMDPDKGYRGVPARAQIAAMCTSCHANAEYMKRFNPEPYVFSVAEFHTSVHYKRLAAGDTKAATCTNCHGLHGILSHKDPRSPVYPTKVPATCAKCHNATYMKGRKLPTNQYEQYVVSVHGKALLEKGDLSAPACNDCHGNHGAAPPAVRDISVVCSNCHGREGELFAKSKVSATLFLEGKRGCVTCHGNHGVQQPTDAMIALSKPGVCGQCHAPGSGGERAAVRITARFDSLRARLAVADSLLTLGQLKGMETEQGRIHLKEASDQLVTLRVALHSFDEKTVDGVLSQGATMAANAEREGRASLHDWRSRRIGTASSVAVIALLIVLLLVKIRSLGPPEQPPPP
jgi:predicted CXXCH cytochrome family protein